MRAMKVKYCGTAQIITVQLPSRFRMAESWGYAQYGLLTGKPLIWLHGLPGSRLEGAGFDEAAKEAGLRLICVDRPGIGWSSPQPGRKLLDLPEDIEELASHLRLDSYSVLVGEALRK